MHIKMMYNITILFKNVFQYQMAKFNSEKLQFFKNLITFLKVFLCSLQLFLILVKFQVFFFFFILHFLVSYLEAFSDA